MKKYFKISGYWKDDNETEFRNYIVTNFDDNGDDEDDIFFYGIEEDEIKNCINNYESFSDFVITSYKIV